MRREPFREYVRCVGFVIGTNIAAILCLDVISSIMALFECACDRHHYYNPAPGMLFAICPSLIVGFVQGALRRRSLTAVAVPVGWFGMISLLILLGRTPSVPVTTEVWAVLIIAPTMASLAARRGSLYSTSRERVHLVWLAKMLALFIVTLGFGTTWALDWLRHTP